MSAEEGPDLQALQSSHHSQCLLCGAEHPHGLRLSFRRRADGRVEADFDCDKLYQGYTGYLHGGVIAALLDSAMTNCLFAYGKTALTGELNIRYVKPVLVGSAAVVGARLKRPASPLYYMEADLRQNGQTVATATAKFVDASRTGVVLHAAGQGVHGTCEPPGDPACRAEAARMKKEG